MDSQREEEEVTVGVCGGSRKVFRVMFLSLIFMLRISRWWCLDGWLGSK